MWLISKCGTVVKEASALQLHCIAVARAPSFSCREMVLRMWVTAIQRTQVVSLLPYTESVDP